MPYVIIFLFSTTGLLALFHPGLFTAHDIWHNVARLYHYHHAVLDGQFPPYWVSSMAEGFGYPLFFFSYHLPWLVGQPFLFAGLSVPVVTKILLFLPHLLSGLTFYLGAYLTTHNRPASLLGSLLYLWAPHRFLIPLVSPPPASPGLLFSSLFILPGFIFYSLRPPVWPNFSSPSAWEDCFSLISPPLLPWSSPPSF